MQSKHFASKDDAERGYEFQVFSDVGEPIDWFITVIGADSRAYKALENQQRQQTTDRFLRTRGAPLKPEEADRQALTLTVSATTTWRGADAPAEFSPDNAKQAYIDFPGVREQADRAINNRGNFLPKSATS